MSSLQYLLCHASVQSQIKQIYPPLGLPTVGCGLTAVGCPPWADHRGPWADHRGPWADHRGPWAAHHGQVEDKISIFLLHEGVRRLDKSYLVFSLNRCWAYWLNSLSHLRLSHGNVYIEDEQQNLHNIWGLLKNLCFRPIYYFKIFSFYYTA